MAHQCRSSPPLSNPKLKPTPIEPPLLRPQNPSTAASRPLSQNPQTLEQSLKLSLKQANSKFRIGGEADTGTVGDGNDGGD
ncbi:hypothetical protein C1H46_034079 [Malus baccata]|uniref:Uncharacterized protein n=1 Tax=Malus baccata TaxID=106549 RepID=A0A540L1Q9_MALBA|nr:hypothetical protein C1H46_034079 [Malus baccata]